jgi:hypothetical protein
MFFPGDPMSIGFIRAYAESGLRTNVALFGLAETSERDLPTMGRDALGIITAAITAPICRARLTTLSSRLSIKNMARTPEPAARSDHGVRL